METEEVVSILLDLKAFHSSPGERIHGCKSVLTVVWTSRDTNGQQSDFTVSKLNNRNVCKAINPDQAQLLVNDNTKIHDLAVKMYSLCGLKLIRIDYSPLVLVFSHSDNRPLTPHKQEIFHLLSAYLQHASGTKRTMKYQINLQCHNEKNGFRNNSVNTNSEGSCLKQKEQDSSIFKQRLEGLEENVEKQQRLIESQISKQEEQVDWLVRKLSNITILPQKQDGNHNPERGLEILDTNLATVATVAPKTTMTTENTISTPITSSTVKTTLTKLTTTSATTTTISTILATSSDTRTPARRPVAASPAFKKVAETGIKPISTATKEATSDRKLASPETEALSNDHKRKGKEAFPAPQEISKPYDYIDGQNDSNIKTNSTNGAHLNQVSARSHPVDREGECVDLEKRTQWLTRQGFGGLDTSVDTVASSARGVDSFDDDDDVNDDDDFYDDDEIDDDDELYGKNATYLDSSYVSEPHKYRRQRGTKQPKILLVRTGDGGTDSDSAVYAVYAPYGTEKPSTATESIMYPELEYVQEGKINFDEKQIEKHIFGDPGLPERKEKPWGSPEGKEKLRTWINHAIGDSPNWSRLSASAEEALLEDRAPVTRTDEGMDTLLCIDTSGSMEGVGLENMKKIVIEFIDGIEAISKTYNIHENIALVTFGGRARVIQHLTNDYTKLRHSVLSLTAGGPGPILEALVVSLACLQHSGLYTIGWKLKLPPRMIFISDGYPTTELPATVHDTTYISESDKDHICNAFQQLQDRQIVSGMPYPIVFVPVGRDPSMACLGAIASYCSGTIALVDAFPQLAKFQRFHKITSEGLLFMRVNGVEKTQNESTFYDFIARFAPDLTQSESLQLFGMFRDHFDLAVMTPGTPATFWNLCEEPELPPLGSRVVRGQDWKWANQDTEGAGTIMNHTNNKLVYVLWDNGHINAYRYGHNGMYDVMTVSDRPKVPETQYPTIGCQVERGPQWRAIYENQDGGEGQFGVVIRKNVQGRILVRWNNGNIFDYRCGTNGNYEVTLRDPLTAILEATASTNTGDESAKAPGIVTESENVTYTWQREDGRKGWETYSDEESVKLNKAYAKNPLGSCLLQRKGVSFRVSFKALEERRISDVKSHVRVRCTPCK